MTKQTLSDPSIIAALIKSHLSAIAAFASLTTRGCFFLNASVGLAIYIKYESPDSRVLLFLALGAIFAVLASVNAWTSQKEYLKNYLDLIFHTKDAKTSLKDASAAHPLFAWLPKGTLRSALLFSFLSIASFLLALAFLILS